MLRTVKERIAAGALDKSEADIQAAIKWARSCRAKSWQAREILSLLGEE